MQQGKTEIVYLYELAKMAANIGLSATVLLFTVSGELAVIKAFAVLPAH